MHTLIYDIVFVTVWAWELWHMCAHSHTDECVWVCVCADRLDLITKQVISKGGAVPRRTHADKPFIPQRHNFRKLSEVDVFRIRTCMLRSPVFSRVDELVSTIQRHEAGEQDVPFFNHLLKPPPQTPSPMLLTAELVHCKKYKCDLSSSYDFLNHYHKQM